MTLQESYRVLCDGKDDIAGLCCEHTPYFSRKDPLVAYAREHGWTQGGNNHYCPKCKSQNISHVLSAGDVGK